MGLGSAQTTFTPAAGVANGGLLLALPSLALNGLLDSLGTFDFKEGYYRIHDIIITIAFMVLGRVETINRLDGVAPGEWGRLIGLDRIPEKKTLRGKTDELSHGSNAANLDTWIAEHSEQWLKTADNDTVGHFYLDGHVRTYFGKASLPYRYVARQKLCMRGLTDYWVNDDTGNPFFAVTTPFNKGLIAVLKEEIVPELLALVPEQSEEEICRNPDAPRLTIIFDREGFSMALFKYLWDEFRIACQTYNKYPKEDWPEDEFAAITETTIFGTTVESRLAERFVTHLENFTAREIRILVEGGRQISVITRDFVPDSHSIMVHMRARQSQENFFRYGRQEFNIDTLASYKKTDVDESVEVINPAWRDLDRKLRSTSSKLGRRHLTSTEITLPDNPTDKQQKSYEARQGEIAAEIEELTQTKQELKDMRSETPKHIPVKDLPEDFKFQTLHGGRKKFIDTVKMICYRAEVAMANIIMPELSLYDRDTARTVVKNIFQTPADLKPDYEKNVLTVSLHHMSTRKADNAIRKLMKNLNETHCKFPGTELELIYDFVSD